MVDDAETAILALLAERAAGKTICPSEAARQLDREDWRAQMDRVRDAGIRLAAAGAIDVTQKGVPVDPHAAKGPIRYRKVVC